MATLCFLKDYNKYFNRTIKPVHQLSDVYNYNKAIFNNINFVENDLVNTTQIINWNYDWIPDYMLIIDNSYGYDPEYMMKHLEFCQVMTPAPQGATVNVDSAEELQELGLMTESGAVKLYSLANYHNDSYSLDYIDFEGNWSLDNFSLYITDPQGQSFNTLVITGDQSTVTLTDNDLPDNGIISKAFLITKGWDPTDTVVYGIQFNAASPDAFNGQLIFSDYVNQCPVKQSWFVLEGDETRKGQFNFSLRRDLVSDDMAAVRTSISNIERCNLASDNPLIYNHEPFYFNQVKKDEIFLYDRTACPWIVGYLSAFKSDGSLPDPIGDTFALSQNYDISMATINHDEWEYYSLAKGNRAVKANAEVYGSKFSGFYQTGFMYLDVGGSYFHQDKYGNNTETDIGFWDTTWHGNHWTFEYSKSNYNAMRDSNRSSWINWSTLTNLYVASSSGILTDTEKLNLEALNGKKILFQDGVYEITFKPYSNVTAEAHGGESTIFNTFKSYLQSHISGKFYNFDDASLYVSYTFYDFYIKKVEDTNSVSYIIPSTTNKLSDAPYRMFCMPYPNATADARGFMIGHTSIKKEINLSVVQNIIENTITGSSDGTDTLYDIQILPYCPIEFASYTDVYGIGNVSDQIMVEVPSSFVSGVDYTDITYTDNENNTTVIGKIFFPKESSFKFTINRTYGKGDGPYDVLNDKFPITNLKIQNETEFARFCSPNYASAYDFTPAKNNGLNAINVLCTYKPYNPFVLVTPEYGGLYGRSFNDSRGLILEGDFSLPIINSHWTQYELNNKTYQQSFNREIKNMDIEFNIQRQEQLFNAIAGTIKGGTQGAAAGAFVGGGYGAIAGALVGTTTSAIGGALDYNNMMKRQSEAIDYKFDMYNYALQNIKALPTALTKTSSLNANSKYVPFIELYSATDAEKAVLSNFITYNGMTAGYVGQINMSGYVQGNIIRYTGSLGEYELFELNKELMKGVYL